MNPNMIPGRSVIGQPIFIPRFNQTFATPPPNGPLFYPQPASSPGVPYQVGGPYQASPTFQYQPLTAPLPISSPELRPGSPLQTGYQSPGRTKPNYTHISQSARPSVMVMSNKGSPSNEMRPASPMSSHLLQTLRHQLTPTHGMTTVSGQLTTCTTTTGSVKQPPSLPDGFLAAYKDDQSFFTLGKMEETNKVKTAEEIFKAKASHYGINITSASDKIKKTTAEAHRKIESEKSKPPTGNCKQSKGDGNTRNFMTKLSQYGIKIENPKNYTCKKEETSHAKAYGHSTTSHGVEHEKSLPKIDPMFEKVPTVPNVKDQEEVANGIEQSQLLHLLETKKNSKYEQMLSALRKTAFSHESYDDLSTPDFQTPREDDAPENFGEVNSDSQNININNKGPDCIWHSRNEYESNLDLHRKPEILNETESKVRVMAESVVRDAVTAALTEVKRDYYNRHSKDNEHKRAMSRSLHTLMVNNQKAILDHKKDFQSAENQSLNDESDRKRYLNERRHSLPISINSKRYNEFQEDKRNSVDIGHRNNSISVDVNAENSAQELSPYSPEFKPSGLKYASKCMESSALKADVPEFIPMYVPKTKSFESIGTCQLEQHNDLDGLGKHIWRGQHGSTQTEKKELIDAMTNTKLKKTSDKIVETKACDVRDIIMNTVESMFDKTSNLYVSDSTEEVDDGHLDVGIQTEENQQSLHHKLIDAQREILRARCYTCRQKLEQEMQFIRRSKYQMYSVFSHLGDRSRITDVVDNRLLSMKGEVHRLERKLIQYEGMLDEGKLFDEIPDFGLTHDMDSCLVSQVTIDNKEVQTEIEIETEEDKLCQVVSEQLKEILKVTQESSSTGAQIVHIMERLVSLLDKLSNKVSQQSSEMVKQEVSRIIAGSCNSEARSSGNSSATCRRKKAVNTSQNAIADRDTRKLSEKVVHEANTQTKSVTCSKTESNGITQTESKTYNQTESIAYTQIGSKANSQTESKIPKESTSKDMKDVLVEKMVSKNIDVVQMPDCEEEKENIDIKSKPSKTKKSKKKKKNRCEQGEIGVKTTADSNILLNEMNGKLKEETRAIYSSFGSSDPLDRLTKEELNKFSKVTEESSVNSGNMDALSEKVYSENINEIVEIQIVECSLEDIDDDEPPIIVEMSKHGNSSMMTNVTSHEQNSNIPLVANDSHGACNISDNSALNKICQYAAETVALPHCNSAISESSHGNLHDAVGFSNREPYVKLDNNEYTVSSVQQSIVKDELVQIPDSNESLGQVGESQNVIQNQTAVEPQGQNLIADLPASIPQQQNIIQNLNAEEPQGQDFFADQLSSVPQGQNVIQNHTAVEPQGQNFIPDQSVSIPQGHNIIQDEPTAMSLGLNLNMVPGGSLYEAVVNQLIQVYPNLAHNPVMLNVVAAQQTQILQMYLNQSGPANQMQGAALASQLQALGLVSNVNSNSINPDTNLNDQVLPIDHAENQNVNNFNISSSSHEESSCSRPHHVQGFQSSIEGTSQIHVDKVTGYTNFKEGAAETLYKENMKNSLESMMDKYLSSEVKQNSQESSDDINLSSPDNELSIKPIKALSSSIIDNNTITKPRPPGFGGKNDYSVDSAMSDSMSVLSSDSSTIVPSLSSTSVDSQERKSSESLPSQQGASELPVQPKPLTIPTQLKQPCVKPSSFPQQLKPDAAHPKASCGQQKPAALQALPKQFRISKPKQSEVSSGGFTFSQTLTSNLPQSSNQSAPKVQAQMCERKVLQCAPDVPQNGAIKEPCHGKLCGFDSNSLSPTDGDTKWNFPQQKYDKPSNLPPRLQKKRRSAENIPQKPTSMPEPSWEDEIDAYPEPFVLKYDPSKPVESHVAKSSVDTLEEIRLPEKKKSIDTKVDEEEWCQVTKKKKKEVKSSDVKLPETRKRHQSAGQSSTELRDRKNNFERLVGMLMEVHTGLNRSQVIDVISEIRALQGGLSGLTVKEIMEIARTVVIRKYEHKMINYQRPLQVSGVKGPSYMADRRKTELQEVMHGSRIVPQETMETLEDRATKMRAFQAMKAQQARVSVTKSESLDDEDDICVICHDELSYGETKTLDCKHEFHTECISKWVYERERTCPTCRGHALFEDDFPKLGS